MQPDRIQRAWYAEKRPCKLQRAACPLGTENYAQGIDYCGFRGGSFAVDRDRGRFTPIGLPIGAVSHARTRLLNRRYDSAPRSLHMVRLVARGRDHRQHDLKPGNGDEPAGGDLDGHPPAALDQIGGGEKHQHQRQSVREFERLASQMDDAAGL
jgi:hypothetical protein